MLRRPSIALTLLLLINFMNYIDRQILAAVEKPIGSEFHVTAEWTGWLVPAFMVTYILFSPLFGFLGDRFRRWPIVGVGVIIWSLASGGSGYVGSFGMLIVMRMLIGTGEAAYGPIAPTIISDLYPIASRGKVLAWFYAAIPVGSALGYVIGGLLSDRWHTAFYLTLPPGILLGIWCLLMPEPVKNSSKDQSSASVEPHSRKQEYLSLLRNRSYVLDSVGMTAMTFALGGLAFWMPRWLEEVAHLSPKMATPTFGAIAAGAGLVATLAGGFTGDWLRSRYTGSYFLVSGAGLLLAAPLTVAMLYTPFPACWGVIALDVFCLFFNTGPSNTIIANVTTPKIRATAFAMNILIIHIFGDALSPPAIGKLQVMGGWNFAFITMSLLMVGGAVAWFCGAKYLEADTIAVQMQNAEMQLGQRLR